MYKSLFYAVLGGANRTSDSDQLVLPPTRRWKMIHPAWCRSIGGYTIIFPASLIDLNRLNALLFFSRVPNTVKLGKKKKPRTSTESCWTSVSRLCCFFFFCVRYVVSFLFLRQWQQQQQPTKDKRALIEKLRPAPRHSQCHLLCKWSRCAAVYSGYPPLL